MEERKSHSYNVIHNIEERSNIGSDLQGQPDSPVKFNENGEGEVGGGGGGGEGINNQDLI